VSGFDAARALELLVTLSENELVLRRQIPPR
jgi:hypothetical protein